MGLAFLPCHGQRDGTALLLSGAVTAASLAGLVALAPYAAEDLWALLGFLRGWDAQPPKVPPLRRRVKVAILGGGVGGTATALWLTDTLGAENVDAVVICDGPIGGRCQVVQVNGASYEAGADSVLGTSCYLNALMSRFGLRRRGSPGSYLPFGIFNGQDFVFSGASVVALGGWRLVASLATSWRLGWRFGFWPVCRLWWLAFGPNVPRWSSLYRSLREGAAFAHPRELLGAVGHGCLKLTQRSTTHWLAKEAGLPPALMEGIVDPSVRGCSWCAGQSCDELNALAGLLALREALSSNGLSAGGSAVCGGNVQVATRALEAAGARHLRGTARLVRRNAAAKAHEPAFEVAYDASECGEAMKASGPSRPFRGRIGAGEDVEGRFVEAFHAVVIAHPLELSAVGFEGCCDPTSPEAASQPSPTLQCSPFRRCVAHFVYGAPRRVNFSSEDIECASGDQGAKQAAETTWAGLPRFIPARVWATRDGTAPFYSIALQLPTETTSVQAAKEIVASAERGEPHVYRILAPRPLTEKEIDNWFARQSQERVKAIDWHACPQYSAPQPFRPFVLDIDGVFYINAIEQVASTVEMSLIGARNVVNLLTDWIAQRRAPRCF